MYSPFSLRICCIAAMAPALTDATSQGKISLSGSPVSRSDIHVLKGSRSSPNDQKNTLIQSGFCNSVFFGSKGKTVLDIPDSVQHVSDFKTCGVVNKKSLQCYPDGQVKFIDKDICKLNIRKASAFQQEFLKSIHILDRMNNPTPLNGKQHPEKATDSTFNDLANEEKPVLVNGKTKQTQLEIDYGNIEKGDTELTKVRKISKSASKEKFDEDFILSKSQHQDSGCSAVNSNTGTAPDVQSDKLSKNLLPLPTITMPQVSNTEKLRAVVETSSAMDMRLDASKSQAQLEKRLEFYLRRIRRLQGKDVEEHIRNQITLCLEYHQKNLHSQTKSISSQDILSLKTNNEFNVNVLNKNLSTAALVNLVQQAQKQASYDSSEKCAKLQETTYSLNIDKRTRRECLKVSDMFLMNSHHTEMAVDSDATESSSGGDSGDEIDVSPTTTRKINKPINRQAEWKWSAERAAMASRWTWLQAQVSDLEYRIRQQSDIYKQIRQSKGSIVLGDPPSPPNLMTKLLPGGLGASHDSNDKQYIHSPCNISTLLSNVDKQANRLTQSLGNVLTPRPSPLQSEKSCASSPANSTVNGLMESPCDTNSKYFDLKETSQVIQEDIGSKNSYTPILSSVADTSCQAARCRPLRSYRKRKLLWTQNLHQTFRKANRLSSVDCQCYEPVTPCPMCGGRYNNKQLVDADHMPYHECVSHLDSAYHPVLSFIYDIPLCLKFVSLMKTDDWMNRQRKNVINKNYKKRKYKTSTFNENRKKIRKNVAAALIHSAKIRNKYEHKTKKRGHNSVLRRTMKKGSDFKRRQAAKIAMAAMRRQASSFSDNGLTYAECNSVRSHNHSANSSMLKELRAETLRKKRAESAYDINNIVIPYSIAASTRVEKLQYKEIATPEWRDISLEPIDELEVEESLDTDNEELSDESFVIRHSKCEAEEKKRFASFIQYPMRRRLRTESNIAMETTATDSFPATPLEIHQISPEIGFGEESSMSVSYRYSAMRKERLSTGSSFDDSLEFDCREVVEPWSLRSFPLPDAEYEEMKAVEPHVYRTLPVRTSQCMFTNTTETCSRTDTTPNSSRPSSPYHSSASNSLHGDDPNDPEWKNGNAPSNE